MFVKIFEQILDSSIAEKYELRHFFEDMLKLADKTGVVDMTAEAIARRINLPLDKVLPLLIELGEPDKKSRSQTKQGRRIVALDSHRDWGWIIVNYEHYRNIRDEETRRAQNRDNKRAERTRKKKKVRESTNSGPLPGEREYVAVEQSHGRAVADKSFDSRQNNGTLPKVG